METTYYQVRVKQEIPYWPMDDDEYFMLESTGRTEEYVAETFPALHLAEIFAKELANEISEGAGYVMTAFTPRIRIMEVTQSRTYKERLAPLVEGNKK